MTLRFAADNLAHSFGTKNIFSEITFAAAGGETVAITGRNGSGKSTLCRICAGLLTPCGGEIYLMSDGVKFPLAPSPHVGFISPDLRWYGELTARENIDFVMRSDHEREVAFNLAREFRIDDVIDSPVSQFSSGMRQRLSLSAVFASDCALRILDEPSAHLDDEGRETLLKLIQKTEKSITIIATHVESEICLAQRRIHLG
ncbi:MAG TPA: ABC transporter ATP-binding protein [Spirochaetota bacterium]